MRINLTKKHNTKAERILGRLLQENRIELKKKVKIKNREIDFLIGKLAIEISGHSQNEKKNEELISLGYIPIHFHNQDIYTDKLKVLNQIKKEING